jgi:ferrous iron transport protein B
MFFAGGAFFGGKLIAACMLTGLILLSVGLTFACSKLLSKTLLKGEASSFVLEMPAYRRPQIGKVIVRSVLDRTLFVLGRAAAVAAPAGLLLWLMANISIEGSSLMAWCAQFLQPFANALGLDGAILLAFILGLPANEIVIPIVLMLYTGAGTMMDLGDLSAMKALLVANGWTIRTALCTLLFMLVHWPCSTTLITIRKESGSWKWMFLAALLPTLAGILLCLLVNLGFSLFA